MLAFESHKVGRARRVDQNLGGFVFSLFEVHLHRTLALAITMNGKLHLVLIFVSKALVYKRNTLSLVEKEYSMLVDVLAMAWM